MSDKCPQCGAEVLASSNGAITWVCGATGWEKDGNRGFRWQGPVCRIRQLEQEVERLKRDYSLFEELSPPDVPRTEFVEWCFDAWVKQNMQQEPDHDP